MRIVAEWEAMYNSIVASATFVFICAHTSVCAAVATVPLARQGVVLRCVVGIIIAKSIAQ